MLNYSAYKLIIAPLFGFSTLGLYKLGFQFLMFLAVIPGSLLQYLLPEEASNINRRFIKTIGILLSVIMAIIFYFISTLLVRYTLPKIY